jgi:type II secretory pathway pseudopilin PulG
MTHSKITTHRHQKGISILEILLALAIVAAITIYLTNMVSFIESGNKVDQSFERMKRIVLQAKTYYLSHETLPAPSVNPADSVPVDNQQLNLSQKHRLDAWGQYFLYFEATTTGTIVSFTVNGRDAAGVLISLGPNQTQDYDGTVPNVYTGGGDDLLVPITVEEEAWQIVMSELDVLDKRVMAYDRVFAGIDNDAGDTNNDGGYIYFPPQAVLPPGYSYRNPSTDSFFLVDEDGCVAVDALPGATRWSGCIYKGTDPNNPATRANNDPNCGRATIDACPTALDALNDLLTLYGLTDPGDRTDPWGNQYQWGNGLTLATSDRRYHVFYSMGPDGRTNSVESHADSLDDITPY